MSNKKIRVGIILNDRLAPVWINEIFVKACLIPNIQLVKVILLGSEAYPKSIFSKIYNWVDNKILPGKPILTSKSKGDNSADLEEIVLNAAGNQVEASLDNLIQSNIDLLILLETLPFQKSILAIPSIKKWILRLGNDPISSSYAGFWVWYNKIPINSLQILEPNQNNTTFKIINSSITKAETLSLSRNQTLLFSKAINLVISSLSSLVDKGDAVSHKEENSNKEPSTPDGFHFLIAFIKLFYRLMNKTLLKLFFIQQWALFIVKNPTLPKLDFRNSLTILPPKDRFWADPFIISQDDKHYIFVEELLYKTDKGHLSCLVVNSKGEKETSKVILEKPYHLSYPFIFNHHNTWFMIPESGENKTVDLYECVEFPFNWQFKKTLLSGFRFYDSTLHFVNDRIWLFCTIQQNEGGSPNDDLHLFSTHDLMEGKWVPHPMNPVVSDPYNARPAGKIFYFDGQWYRPSQVCVPRYGYALAINRIDQLDESSYRETQITQVLPNWHKHLIANHTYNSTDQIAIVDGILKRFRF